MKRRVEVSDRRFDLRSFPWALGQGPQDPAWRHQASRPDAACAQYSWQLGREINIPSFGARPEQYAPWDAATAVVLWPSVFDTRGVPAGPGLRSTSIMQHFANFVLGANGERRLVATGPPTPEAGS